MSIIPIPEHDLLVLWVQLVVLLTTARLLGGALRRLGQPAVVGELAAGVLLGPSLLGKLWPAGAAWLFPPEPVPSALLLVVGWLGVIMLLVVTGFETDLALIAQLGRAAAAVAVSSVFVPFALGLALGFALPAPFLPVGRDPLVFALFVAAALSISSLPVIAKILGDLGMMRRNFGQLTLAAGMANDVIGWVLLGAIAGLARSGAVELGPLAVTLVGMALFLVAALTVGQRLADRVLRSVRTRTQQAEGPFAVTIIGALVAGALTQALGVEAVLGAFVAGIVLGRSRYQHGRVPSYLQTVSSAVFAPIFFATAGLRVDLAELGDAATVAWVVALVAVASVGKFAGAWVGGRLAGLPAREGLALGVGLNARGALEIVIATVGLSLGVLNSRSYAAVVLLAIVTSMAAPPLLRRVVAGWSGSAEERERLRREEILQENLLVTPQPFLVPVQQGDGSVVAAHLLDRAWPPGTPATVVAVGTDSEEALSRTLDQLGDRPVDAEELFSDDPVDAVIGHLDLGFGALGVGAHEGRDRRAALSPLTQGLLERARRPTVVVWEGTTARADAAVGFDHVLVVVEATVWSRPAQELAFELARSEGSRVTLVQVMAPVREPVGAAAGARSGAAGRGRGAGRERNRSIGRSVLAAAADHARRVGLRPESVLLEGAAPADEVLRLAEDRGADLVVVGAELQPVAGEAFLGALVEDLVHRAEATVAVVAAPAQWLATTRPEG